jgi:predicted enzyme related to lactoylglutathione lyase
VILRVWDVTFTVSDLERAVDFYENVYFAVCAPQ